MLRAMKRQASAGISARLWPDFNGGVIGMSSIFVFTVVIAAVLMLSKLKRKLQQMAGNMVRK